MVIPQDRMSTVGHHGPDLTSHGPSWQLSVIRKEVRVGWSWDAVCVCGLGGGGGSECSEIPSANGWFNSDTQVAVYQL